MHVFIITQYFPPEIGASASRWGDYVDILIKQNYQVTVLCENPHYPGKKYYSGYKNLWINIEKKSSKLTIIRSKAFASDRKSFIKKITHYLVFMISAIINSKKVKYFDILIISSPPLFTGAIGLFLSRFRKKYWLDIRDLWPDSALELNQINKGFFYKIGKKLELLIYRNAKGFIFPVPAFRAYLKQFSESISQKSMFELMNGVSFEFTSKSSHLDYYPYQNFTVLYSGNMGLAQDLKTIIKAADILKKFNIDFRFVGNGVCKKEIKNLAKPLSEKIFFHDSVERNSLIKIIKQSSVCLVPLKDKKIFENALPSKMFEYMACGKPVIVNVKGDAKKIVHNSESGTVIDPENPVMLSNAILSYFNNPDKRKVHGDNGMRYIEKNLSKEILISKLINELKK